MAYHGDFDRHSWQEQRTNHLVGELKSILSLLPPGIGLAELLEEPLSVVRRGLAPQAKQDTPWHLLPLMVCESVCGDYETALPAAAAFQLMVTAGDVFDDIADNDSRESIPAKYGFGTAINAATTLMVLAQQAIGRLKMRGVTNRTIIRLFGVFNSYGVKACTGQHLDLSTLEEARVTENQYLKILSLKSASQIECACHTGALVGGADSETTQAYRKFGQNLGMAAQITNDIIGITSGKDIANRKITLPVVFALTNLDKSHRFQIEKAYTTKDVEKMNIEQTQKLLFETGALYYANLKRQIFKQKALDALSRVENRSTGVDWCRYFLTGACKQG